MKEKAGVSDHGAGSLAPRPSSVALFRAMRTMPTALERLPELAQNLWWSWHLEARDFFRALDETLWRETRHNPVRFLHEIAAERLVLAAADPEILRRYETVMKAFDAAIRGDKNWCAERHPAVSGCTLAFFSAEYGIPRQDVVIDPIAMTVAAEPTAGLVTLETMRLVREATGLR